MQPPQDIKDQPQVDPSSTGRVAAFIAGYLWGLAAPFYAMAAVVRILTNSITGLVSLVYASIASLLSFVAGIAAHLARAVLALLSGLFAVLLGLLTVAAAMGAIFLLFSLIAAMRSSQPTPQQVADRPAPPRKLLTKQPARDEFSVSIVTTVAGAKQRHTIEFAIFSRACNWPKADAESIICGSERLVGDAFVRDRLLPHIQGKFLPGTAIVSIGAASSEGRPEVELPRALLRAEKVAEWLAPHIGRVPIWVVSLGQYSSTCSNCDKRGTDWQRPLIVALINATDAKTDISAIVQTALSQESALPKPSDYVGFTSRRWR